MFLPPVFKNGSLPTLSLQEDSLGKIIQYFLIILLKYIIIIIGRNDSFGHILVFFFFFFSAIASAYGSSYTATQIFIEMTMSEWSDSMSCVMHLMDLFS